MLVLSPLLSTGHYKEVILIGVYTGLRFSNVAALRPTHIQADRLRVATQKTQLTITVPVRHEARPLLARVSEGTLRPLATPKTERPL